MFVYLVNQKETNFKALKEQDLHNLAKQSFKAHDADLVIVKEKKPNIRLKNEKVTTNINKYIDNSVSLCGQEKRNS